VVVVPMPGDRFQSDGASRLQQQLHGGGSSSRALCAVSLRNLNRCSIAMLEGNNAAGSTTAGF